VAAAVFSAGESGRGDGPENDEENVIFAVAVCTGAVSAKITHSERRRRAARNVAFQITWSGCRAGATAMIRPRR
jgi:hypothetical protein